MRRSIGKQVKRVWRAGGSALIAFEFLDPLFGDRYRGVGADVEARHYGAAGAFDLTGFDSAYTLFDHRTLFANRNHSGLHLDFFVEEGRGTEVGVDINDHHPPFS